MLFKQSRVSRLHSKVPIARRAFLQNALSDLVLVSPPLFAALAAFVLGAHTDGTIKLLVVILLVSSTVVFVRSVVTGLAARRLGMLLVMLGFIGWYALPAFLRMYAPGVSASSDTLLYFSNDILVLTTLCLALFLFTWLLAYRMFAGNRHSMAGALDDSFENPVVLMMLALVAVAIGLIPYLASGLSFSQIGAVVAQGRSVDKPWAYVEHLGNETSPFLHLASGLRTAGATLLLVAVLDRRLPKLWRLVAGLASLSVIILMFFDQGTRSITALMLLPAVLLVLSRVWTQSRLGAAFIVTVIGMVLLLVLQFQLFVRTDAGREQLSDQLLDSWTTFGGTTDYFAETAFALQIVPSYHDFFRESALLDFVTLPIPRALWANKPVTQVAAFYTLMRWGRDVFTERGNVFPGIVGQYYMSWGWFGPVILGVVFAYASFACDRFLARTSSADTPYRFGVGAMFAVWLLITYRFLSPGFAYPVACAAGLLWVSRIPKRQMSGQNRRGDRKGRADPTKVIS